jgi:hypothetical protein
VARSVARSEASRATSRYDHLPDMNERSWNAGRAAGKAEGCRTQGTANISSFDWIGRSSKPCKPQTAAASVPYVSNVHPQSLVGEAKWAMGMRRDLGLQSGSSEFSSWRCQPWSLWQSGSHGYKPSFHVLASGDLERGTLLIQRVLLPSYASCTYSMNFKYISWRCSSSGIESDMEVFNIEISDLILHMLKFFVKTFIIASMKSFTCSSWAIIETVSRSVRQNPILSSLQKRLGDWHGIQFRIAPGALPAEGHWSAIIWVLPSRYSHNIRGRRWDNSMKSKNSSIKYSSGTMRHIFQEILQVST